MLLRLKFTFPLGGEYQRDVNLLAEQGDGNIGSIALGDTFRPIPAAFEDSSRDISRISVRDLSEVQKRSLHLPASGPGVKKKPIMLIYVNS